MKPTPVRVLVTLALLILAGLVAWQLWIYYMEDPWTRDGRVRADTVALAADVSGPVLTVFVHDNQPVHAGDPLFAIDPERFTLAIDQAQAQLTRAKAALDDAQRTADRYAALSSNAVAAETRDTSNTQVLEAQAQLAQAQADADVAALNLRRSIVRATVNGIVTNFSMRPGDYVGAGTAVVAIVDTDSLYVDGYFEETKLRRIALGDPARITLLDGAPPIAGHVVGIAAGIADAERSPGLLADVNPTFTWVRLAQRVPVRIALDHVPAGEVLVAGMTATVAIVGK
jgi:RND family efflux transporter MFP subunit